MSLQNWIILPAYEPVWCIFPIFFRRIPRNSCQSTLSMFCTLQDYLHPIALALCHTPDSFDTLLKNSQLAKLIAQCSSLFGLFENSTNSFFINGPERSYRHLEGKPSILLRQIKLLLL